MCKKVGRKECRKLRVHFRIGVC